MHLRLGGLWCHPGFRKLWLGNFVSSFGSRITLLALPLTAVLLLHASASHMGVLGAAETVPFLAFGLFAGVWVDRLPRRRVLIAADAGRAVLLGTIPAAAAVGALRLEFLYAVAFLAGILTVFSEVAYGSFLPSLVGRDRLVEGNSKLEAGRGIAEIAGPGIGGTLVALLTAPFAIALDALSFVWSALCVSRVRIAEPIATRQEADTHGQRNMWKEIGGGLHIVARHPLMRVLIAGPALWNLAWYIWLTVFVLYVTRDLGLRPGVLGVVFATSGVGSLAGAVMAGRLTRWLRLGPAIVLPPLLAALGTLLFPLARGPAVVAMSFLVTGQFLFGFGVMLYVINSGSLRQVITPDHLLGRVNGIIRFLTWGMRPIGALVGGGLGESIGSRLTLLVGTGGLLLVVVIFRFSPLWTLRESAALIEGVPPRLGECARLGRDVGEHPAPRRLPR